MPFGGVFPRQTIENLARRLFSCAVDFLGHTNDSRRRQSYPESYPTVVRKRLRGCVAERIRCSIPSCHLTVSTPSGGICDAMWTPTNCVANVGNRREISLVFCLTSHISSVTIQGFFLLRAFFQRTLLLIHWNPDHEMFQRS